MDALELCNKINMEAESLADSGFPLEVFPQKMQSIIIDMVVHGNFKVDYVAMSMLSAASAALGNTYRIHVKQDWDTNAALYIILVGRPGMGKLHHYSLHTSQFGSMNESCLICFAMNLTYMRQHVQQRKAEARK